jgi:hypothetical protein
MKSPFLPLQQEKWYYSIECPSHSKLLPHPPVSQRQKGIQVADNSVTQPSRQRHYILTLYLLLTWSFRNICRTEYMEQNPGKTNSQFEVHWRKLSDEQKKIFTDKYQASKTKSQAKGKGKAMDTPFDSEILDDDGQCRNETVATA